MPYEAPPILAAKLLGSGSSVDLQPRPTWHLEELVSELLPRVVSGRGSQSRTGHEIQLTGSFAGPPPGLELPPATISTLAEAGVGLSIDLSSSPLDSARRGTRRGVNEVFSEVTVSFLVSGHFDPDTFSQRTGLQPTTVIREDEQRPVKPRVSVWKLGTASMRERAVPAAVTDQLLGLLTPRSFQIRAVVADGGLRSALTFFVVLRDVVPTVRILPDQLGQLAGLNGWLDLSITALRDSDTRTEF